MTADAWQYFENFLVRIFRLRLPLDNSTTRETKFFRRNKGFLTNLGQKPLNIKILIGRKSRSNFCVVY